MIKTIHQIAISDFLPKGYVAPNYESITKNFKGYQYILWDYKKIKSFILKNGDNDVLDAIDSIKANAFKADIARYYIVYKLGGWYTDLNNFFEHCPPTDDVEMIFFRDSQNLTEVSWGVQNSLFYSNAVSKPLEKAISHCVTNVKNNYYGGHPLCVTSPILFGSAIASCNLDIKNQYLIGDFVKNNSPGFYLENRLFASYKSNGLASAESGLPSGNNYEELWLERRLYS